MKSDKALWEICMNIYREAYSKADPPADFDKLISSGEAKKEHFYMKHYLSEKDAADIFDKHTKGLSKYEKHQVSKEVYLGSLPTSVKDNWYMKWLAKKK